MLDACPGQNGDRPTLPPDVHDPGRSEAAGTQRLVLSGTGPQSDGVSGDVEEWVGVGRFSHGRAGGSRCVIPSVSDGKFSQPIAPEQVFRKVIGFNIDRETAVEGKASDGEWPQSQAAVDVRFSVLVHGPVGFM